MTEPLLIGYDPASGPDESVIAHLQHVTYGTGICIVEMSRPTRRKIEELREELILTFQPLSPHDMYLCPHDPAPKPVPWDIYTFEPEPARRRPPVYRPQQRSARMRKHTRIVRSRMTPSERRKNAAHFARTKRWMDKNNIINPNASKFWKDFF